MTEDNAAGFELILEIHNAGDQAFIKSLLDAEGIVYFIQGEHVAPYLYHALAMRLMVRKDQAALARDLLKDFEASSAYRGLKAT
jgi:Putative prokaryotic signal transducing protein